MTREILEMLLSWGRVFLATVLAQLVAGVQDWSIILNSAWISVIPVIIRWLDSQDPVYGRGVKK